MYLPIQDIPKEYVKNSVRELHSTRMALFNYILCILICLEFHLELQTEEIKVNGIVSYFHKKKAFQ